MWFDSTYRSTLQAIWGAKRLQVPDKVTSERELQRDTLDSWPPTP